MLKNSHHLSWECDFDTSTELYATRFGGKAGRMILHRQNELLSRFLGDIRGQEILDVGAGHGQTAGAVLSEGGNLTAYGSSQDSFHQLMKTIKGRSYDNNAVSFRVGRLDKLPFEDRRFDITISFRLVSHVPDWIVFLRELCRVSRNSVIFDFAPDSFSLLKPLFCSLKGKFEIAAREFTTQSVEDVEKVAVDCGFKLRDYERQFVIPMVFHRAVKGRLLLPVERTFRMFGLTRVIGGPVITVLDRIGREGAGR